MTTGTLPRIKILAPHNPKKFGTAAWHRFNLYKNGMTAAEFLRAGGTRADLHFDTQRGYIDMTTIAETNGTTTTSPGSAAKPSSNRAAAINRIRALAAKTIDNGCTEEEAMAAAAKMGELMDKYGIESSETELREEVCTTGVHGGERAKAHEVKWCATAIAEYCSCRVWQRTGKGRGGVIAFYGMPADVEVATYLMKVIQGAMDRAYKDFRKSPSYPTWESPKRVRNTFLIAMSNRINSRLRRVKEERDAQHATTTTGTSLILVKAEIVNQQLAKTGIRITKGGGGSSVKTSSSNAAAAAGAAAGDRVSLNPALNGGGVNHTRITK